MATKRNITQVVEELRRAASVANKNASNGAGGNRLSEGISRFLTGTSFAELDKGVQAEIRRILRNSPWEGQPDNLYRDLVTYDRGNEVLKQDREMGPAREHADPRASEAGGGTGRNRYGNATTQQFVQNLVQGSLDPGQGGGNREPSPGAAASPPGGGNRGGARDDRADPYGNATLPPAVQPPRAAPSSAPPSVAPSAAPTAPTAPATGGGGTPPSGLTPTQAALMVNSPTDRLMQALKAAGYDPTRPGRIGQFLVQLLKPGLDAVTHLLPFQNGGDGMGIDDMATADQYQRLAKAFVTPGANPFAAVRTAAQDAASNPAFMNMVGGLSNDEQQFNMLSALLGAKTYGLNGLVQQSLGDQANRSYAQFQMNEFDNAREGGRHSAYLDWLRSQPEPVRRILLGQ